MCSGVPFCDLISVLAMSLTLSNSSQLAHVDLLQAFLDEAASGVDVVVLQLLFDLRQAQSVGDQLFRIHPDLVFARGSAETGNVDHIRHGLELLFENPVLKGLQLHHLEAGIRAGERVPVDLPDRTPVGSHLRLHVVRQSDGGEPLQRL